MGIFSSSHTFTFFIDLSQGSCGIALTDGELGTAKPIKVLTTRRIPLSDTTHRENQIRSLRRAVDDLINACTQEYSVKVYDIVFMIHAPYTTSSFFEYEKKFEKETLITESLLKDISDSYASVKNERKDTASYYTIHEYIQTVFMNGYPTKNPTGKYAHTIAIKVVEDTTPVSFYESIISPYKQRARKIKTVGYTQMIGRMLSLEQSSKRDFAFVNVGKMHTEISLYSQSTIIKNLLIHCGTYTLVESLSRNAGMTRESAETMLRMDTNNPVHEQKDTLIAKAIRDAQAEFNSKLKEMSADGVLIPKLSYYIEDSEWGVAVQNMLSQGPAPVLVGETKGITIDQGKVAHLEIMDRRLLYGIYACHTYTDTQKLLT